MNLSESVKSAETMKDKAQVIWEHYQSRKLASNFEPHWVHSAYESIRQFIEEGIKSEDQHQLVQEVISSHSLPDGYSVPAFPGMPNSPMRIIHDGWKSGTPTWIFMGRSLTPDAVRDIGDGWIAVSRTIPDSLYEMMDKSVAPATLWLAYHIYRQMGTSALTSNCVGPAVTFKELMAAVEEEKYATASDS